MPLFCAAVSVWAGCSEGTDITERFFECRDLSVDKETRDESLKCFTRDSQKLLGALLKQRKSSAGALDYMGRYKKLLDFEDVVANPEIIGDMAVLVVAKGKRKAQMIWVKEESEWRIDALELPEFWYPLDEKLRSL
jgi:hypothetical protein